MKSIVLVCRSWYNTGTVFLYQHICVRRLPQLECLRETLYTSTSSPRNLGALVKSLDIQCYIPEEFATEFAENLCAIMKLCPFLSTFGYTSPCTLPPSALPTSCLKSQVTHLQLHHAVHYTDLVSILGDLQDQLLVLHVEISHEHLAERSTSSGSTLEVVPDPKTRLIFPSLLALSLSLLDRESTHVLSVLMVDWTMLSLQRFSISEHGFVPGGLKRPSESQRVRGQEALINFLSIHGRGLLHLRTETCIGRRLPQVLEHCPLLERLVMYAFNFSRRDWIPENQVLHAKLRYLDLIHHYKDRFLYVDDKLWISEEVLPSLQLVRHLCDIPSYLFKWVDSFEPHSEVGSNDFAIRLFQQRVVYEDGVLLYDFKPEVPRRRFSVWEDVATHTTDDESDHWQEPHIAWEDESFGSETSSNESSSDESEEWEDEVW